MANAGVTHDLPADIKMNQVHKRHRSIDKIRTPFGFVPGRAETNRVFDVKNPSHSKSKNGGVVFTVETVDPALESDQNMDRITREKALEAAGLEAQTFYRKDSKEPASRAERRKTAPKVSTPDVRLEAMSKTPESLVFTGGHGFLAACMTAFARHLPLSLDPTDIWTVISFAFAKHLDKHAEELREKFVSHEGQKELIVFVDHFRMSRGNDPDTGTPAEDWERDVFPDFSNQIKEHVGEETHAIIADRFSTSTSVTQAASEIALMASMKHYFTYTMVTRCGIPSIELRGCREDWTSLRSRAEKLGELMTPEFSKKWMPILLPILDEFVKSYDGDVNYGFWQSMVKFRDTGAGSGSYSFVSGWIQNLFPYLSSGRENKTLRSWQEAYFDGPQPCDFPSIVCSVPVIWKYFEVDFNLHFHGGFDGFCQDRSDGTISPSIGWVVTHDPK